MRKTILQNLASNFIICPDTPRNQTEALMSVMLGALGCFLGLRAVQFHNQTAKQHLKHTSQTHDIGNRRALMVHEMTFCKNMWPAVTESGLLLGVMELIGAEVGKGCGHLQALAEPTAKTKARSGGNSGPKD